jgi:hypothetical protein
LFVQRQAVSFEFAIEPSVQAKVLGVDGSRGAQFAWSSPVVPPLQFVVFMQPELLAFVPVVT